MLPKNLQSGYDFVGNFLGEQNKKAYSDTYNNRDFAKY
tara:strand:+ start:535 stop:648 length:114 start_codon:yes stop_codon:yes gene_type:complete